MTTHITPGELARVLGTTQNNICDFAKRHTRRASINPHHPRHSGPGNYYEYEHALLVYIAYNLMKIGLNGGSCIREICDWLRPRLIPRYDEEGVKYWLSDDGFELAIPVGDLKDDLNRKLQEVRDAK